MARWALVGVLAVLAVGLVAMSVRANADPVPATFAERLQAPPQVLPADRVPQLIDLWSESFTGPQLEGVTYYSTNRPLVTVCLGDEATCRYTMGMAAVLRTEQVGPHRVTIGVVRPGRVEGLGPELLHYWKTVPLVRVPVDGSAAPAWMAEDSTYTR